MKELNIHTSHDTFCVTFEGSNYSCEKKAQGLIYPLFFKFKIQGMLLQVTRLSICLSIYLFLTLSESQKPVNQSSGTF